MKLEDIQNEWGVDCRIDPLKLSEESSRSPILHAKYRNILSHERAMAIKLERDLNRTRLHFRQHIRNPQQSGIDAGFLSTASKNKNIKLVAEYKQFEEGDHVLTQHEANLALQKEKVEYAESIMWEIGRRKDHISNIIKDKNFESGN